MKKRLLSMLLALVMVIGLLPTSALAGPGYGSTPGWGGGGHGGDTDTAPTPGSDAGKSIIAVIKQGTPNDNEYVGAYNKIKVRLEDTDYNSLALKTGAQSEITFNTTEIDPDDIASAMSVYIPEGYYYVGAFFYWYGQPDAGEDYQTGNPKYVGKFVNKGTRSTVHPEYYSYIGFTTTSSEYGDDWNDNSDFYAYNPTGTLHLVYAKLSEEIGDTVDNVWVKLNCETNASHTEGYDLLDGSFTLSPVSTSGSTRTRTMTINAAKYVEAFNKNTEYPSHTLVGRNSTTITLEYDSSKQVWKPQNSLDVPVKFTVKCEATPYTLSYSWNLPTGASETLPTGGSYYAGDAVTLDTKYVKGSTTKVGHDTYTFSGWVPDSDLINGMPAKAVVVTGEWKLDNWKDNGNGTGSETGGDGVPDEHQALVKFAAKENGTVSGTGTVQVFTMDKTNDGTYKKSKTVTPSLTNVTTTPASGYAFDIWTMDTGNTGVAPEAPITVAAGSTTTFYANFAEDTKGGKDTNGGSTGDGTPDKYQAEVTYAVVNGTWIDGSNAAKSEWFTLYTYDGGKWTATSPAPTLGDTIPTGMKPDSSHTEVGAWDKAIDSTTSVTEGAVYTYTFGTLKSFTITVSVTNGTASPAESPVNVQYNGSQTITFSANEGFALDTVTVDGNPAVLTNGSYAFENVTGNHTIAVVYAEDTKGGKDTNGGSTGDGTPDKYQAEVTYQVVNGTWSDGSNAAKSEWFTLYTYDGGVWTAISPAPTLGNTIPTGMKPDDGYAEDGKWSFPELSGETVVTGTVTYTYTFLPIGGTSFNPNDIYGEDDGSETAALVSKTLSGSLPFGFRETFSVTMTNKENAAETYTGYASMSGTGTLPFVFDQAITFPQPGQYVYTVTEARGSTTYIKYDTASYTLIVWVDYAEQESGDTVRQLEVKGWQFSGEDEAQQLTITNTASYVAVIVPPADPSPTINVKGLDTVNHVAYIVGRDTGLVDPNGTITRAEVATIYFRLMTEEWRNLYWDDANSYSDVDSDDWYNVAISTLEKAGVIKDTRTGGAFRPNDPITRAELAVMAAQFCTVTGKIPAVSFLDVPATHWAYDEIALIEYAGWIEGFEGYFRPDDNLSRAECVTIVNRMLNRGVEPENMLANMVVFPDNLNVNAWYYAAIQEAANSHTYTRTGKKLTGEIFYGEQWLVLLPATDWAALEQAWASTYRA